MQNAETIASAAKAVESALLLAMERLEINDYDGEESEALETVADAEMTFRNAIAPAARAAPAMLAALQELVAGNYGQPHGVTVPALDNARAAIAAATGSPIGDAKCSMEGMESAALQFVKDSIATWGEKIDNDEDINGGDAVEWLGWLIEDARKIVNGEATPATPTDGTEGELINVLRDIAARADNAKDNPREHTGALFDIRDAALAAIGEEIEA